MADGHAAASRVPRWQPQVPGRIRMPWTPWAGLVLEQPGRLGYSLIIFDPKAITG